MSEQWKGVHSALDAANRILAEVREENQQIEQERDFLRAHLATALRHIARAQRAGLTIDEEWMTAAKEAAGLI